MFMNRLLCLLFVIFVSTSSFAYDFSAADDLFSKRAESFETAMSAISSYKAALEEGATGEDKNYAVAQIARLSLFAGAMFDDVEAETEKEILSEALKAVELIAEDGSEEYYYFKLACLAIGTKLAGMFEKFEWGLKLRLFQSEALNSSTRGDDLVGGFAGGGVLRLLAAIYSNLDAKILGLYDPQHAIILAQTALDSEAQINVGYSRQLSGRDYYENYFYLAQAKLSLAIEKEDRSILPEIDGILSEGLAAIESSLEEGLLDRVPETMFYKKRMEEFKAALQEPKDDDIWLASLIELLEII
jgi:hypothetical protein